MSTFETFVVSEPSRLAFTAALVVSERPGRVHNPLVLYGGTGSGKTHLLQAIEHAMQSRRPDAAILRVPADAILRRVLEAIRSDELRPFAQSLGDLDALLIDDLPSMRSTPVMRAEIFRRVKALVDGGVQVVVTSQHLPPETASFGDALAAEVGYPDRPARLEIARQAAAMRKLDVPDDVLRRLANRTTGSPRELQSAIARLALLAPAQR